MLPAKQRFMKVASVIKKQNKIMIIIIIAIIITDADRDEINKIFLYF